MEHMGVTVEVWPVAADSAGIWLLADDAWRTDRIGSASEPHFEVELEMMRHDAPPAALLHSTSWRTEGQGIVLTYMAVVPVDDLVLTRWPGARPLSGQLLAVVGNPPVHAAAEPPAPRYVDVLMHGLRHLRFLRDTDGTARAVLAGDWARHLDRFEPALAGMYDTPAA